MVGSSAPVLELTETSPMPTSPDFLHLFICKYIYVYTCNMAPHTGWIFSLASFSFYPHIQQKRPKVSRTYQNQMNHTE